MRCQTKINWLLFVAAASLCRRRYTQPNIFLVPMTVIVSGEEALQRVVCSAKAKQFQKARIYSRIYKSFHLKQHKAFFIVHFVLICSEP